MSYDVRFARVIDAATEAVFDAFTQLGGQQAFYGTDDPGWIVETECDFRVGGLWPVTFGHSPGELYGFPTAELRDEHRAGLPNAFARLGRAVGS